MIESILTMNPAATTRIPQPACSFPPSRQVAGRVGYTGLRRLAGTRRSPKLSYRESFGGGCGEQCSVASDHDDVRIADSVGSREVDRVVPAQLTDLSQFASTASEDVIDFDKVDLLEQGLALSHEVS
jgi:hypothetical protein